MSCESPSASCFLPSALLLSAFCLLLSRRQSLLQDFFLRLLDRHSVSLTILIDWAMLEHVVPLLAQGFDFPKRIFRITGSASGGRFGFIQRRALFQRLAKSRRALQTRLGWQAFIAAQSHRRARRLLRARLEHAKHSPRQKENGHCQHKESHNELHNAANLHVAQFMCGVDIANVRDVGRLCDVPLLIRFLHLDPTSFSLAQAFTPGIDEMTSHFSAPFMGFSAINLRKPESLLK